MTQLRRNSASSSTRNGPPSNHHRPQRSTTSPPPPPPVSPPMSIAVSPPPLPPKGRPSHEGAATLVSPRSHTMSVTTTYTPPTIPSPYALAQRQPSIPLHPSPLNPNPNPTGMNRHNTTPSSSQNLASSSLNGQSPTPLSPQTPFTGGEDTQRPLLHPASRNPSVADSGSMILWRMTTTSKPPEGVVYNDDSKYPASQGRPVSTLIPYAYNPFLDLDGTDFDEGDEKRLKYRGFNWRGVLTLGGLLTLISGILTLFVFFPIFSFYTTETRRTQITNNVRVNATGQTPDLPNLPQLIDPDTPDNAKTRTGFDGQEYDLVFSDEFERDGRTFWPGDDPFWEAVDLWYWPTGDLEWYDPRQVTTRDGALIITMENIVNHDLNYRSGMLQSWNKFCFTTGYIEVALSLPGQNDEVQGYWPGAWIMGNLGRPGYGATTDGMWPYSYDSCDVGTFPNQTNQDHTAPAAALHTDQGRAKYNFELSWLTGQRLSSCTCPGEDHPGPVRGGKFLGRGAPEIDVLEAQKNKLGDGAKVSQSVQMAPFNADYQAHWDTLTIRDPSITARNSYNGSAVQQAVSCLTTIPPRIFNGTGGEYATFGFEYWSDENNRDSGYITWQTDSQVTYTATAGTLAGDPDAVISDRLIPEEPMSIILNLALSESFQNVDLSTLTFPAEFRVDYVRVYQRKGAINIGCDGKDRPTTQYIQDHLLAYSNPNLTQWSSTNFPKPKNGLYNGAC